MKQILAVVSVAIMISALGFAEEDETIGKRVRTLLSGSGHFSEADLTTARDHPREVQKAAEPFLRSSEPGAKAKALELLAYTGDDAVRYFVEMVHSENQDERWAGIGVGIRYFPQNREVAKAFVAEVVQATEPAERANWLALFENYLKPLQLPAEERERLRPILEQAITDGKFLNEIWIAPLALAGYRDAKSKAFIRSASDKRNARIDITVPYVDPLGLLVLAKAIGGDAPAIEEVTHVVENAAANPDLRTHLISLVPHHLKHIPEVQRSLLKLLEDVSYYKARCGKEMAIDPPSNEDPKCAVIATAALSLASCLDIPSGYNRQGPVPAEVIRSIRDAAVLKLH